jgi:hypothetical protein
VKAAGAARKMMRHAAVAGTLFFLKALGGRNKDRSPANTQSSHHACRPSGERRRASARQDRIPRRSADGGITQEETMNVLKSANLICLIGLSATPVLAEDAMGTMSMMKGGEVVAVMPDGHMGTMMIKPDDIETTTI